MVIEMTTVSKLDKVTFKDWLLALIGLLFTLGGLLIIKKDFKTGITTLALFGACFASAVRVIIRKSRLQKQSLVTAAVAGGEPIRPSRRRIAMLGVGLLAVGSVLAIFQPDGDKIFFGCALFMALAGSALLVGLATGRLSKAYLQFDPPGLSFGDAGGRAVIPWDAIERVARGELSNNPVVFLSVDRDSVVAEPSSYLGKVQRRMASSRSWTGADFVIMSSTYGIDATVLVAALTRYMTSPESRQELRARPRLGD